MVRVYKPFDIVTSSYLSLDGTIKTFANGDIQKGLFMVLANDYGNLTCAKITSQENCAFLTHSVLLTKSANYFLKTDSYVQLDKLHTLSANNVSYLGYADKPSRESICKTLDGYLNLLSQNVHRFSNPVRRYVSPNVRY